MRGHFCMVTITVITDNSYLKTKNKKNKVIIYYILCSDFFQPLFICDL